MKIFDFEALKASADARDVAVRLLNMKPKSSMSNEWVSFDNPWRPGSNSGAFSVSAKGYRDHVSDESGSALDLVANTLYGGDLMQAQEALGVYLGLPSSMESRVKKKFVCAYDYVDATGKMVHQTVRFEPKSFSQRRPDPAKEGEWIWSLKDIEPVLYRLPQLIASTWVCLVGGEKDAENLASIGIPATTNPMGEGNWRDSYNQHFKDKAVIILPDLDDVGRKHAQVVAFAIKGIAKSIRIIELPFPADADPHKDPSDWITFHRGQGIADTAIADNLKRIIKETPILVSEEVLKPVNTQVEIVSAKKANREPFRNYEWGIGHDDKGKEKNIKVPRHINAMREDVMRRFFNFPRRIGGSLFDHDRETKKINIFDRPPELMGWIQEKSKNSTEWGKVEGCVTEPEFFASLLRNTKAYEAISGVPNWPTRPDDVYYTHGELPAPTPDAKAFNEFCQFFSPSSEADFHLFRAFIASPLYYKPKVDRPLWVLDATSGQGSGKTKAVEMVTLLYGGDDPDCGEPAWIDAGQLNNDTTLDRSVKRLLSSTGRKKRIALLDNVTGYFRSPALATLVTQGSISGLAPYGHGEETRPNDLTWVITSNSATLDRDLSDRSQIVKLCKPTNPRPRWVIEVTEFIRKNRLQIISDIIGILERGPQFDFKPCTRFREWETDVLVPILGTREIWESTMEVNRDRQRAADGDIEDAATIRELLRHKLGNLGINMETEIVWIHNAVLAEWIQSMIPGFGGKTQRGCTAHIKNMVKVGLMPELSDNLESWPHNGSGRRRGFMVGESRRNDDSNVKIVGMDCEGVIKVL